MANEPLVLAVDDEMGILRLITLELTAQGFRVITASSGDEALAIAETQRPDIVLLDVVMPEMSGHEVLRALRERTPVPVILVTARDREVDKVRGLELGADDYIVKPFGADEMGARIRAVLRRTAGISAEQVVRAGDITVDLGKRLVHRNGEQVSVTRTEWQLLQHLAANAGKVILSGELLSKVWGPEYRDDLQYLRVWISRLRHKLEAEPSDPKIIKTLAGIGYMFQPDAEVAQPGA
ncbi:MAG: response regulator transcription factor [Tepidiformaceae bacterium]